MPLGRNDNSVDMSDVMHMGITQSRQPWVISYFFTPAMNKMYSFVYFFLVILSYLLLLFLFFERF